MPQTRRMRNFFCSVARRCFLADKIRALFEFGRPSSCDFHVDLITSCAYVLCQAAGYPLLPVEGEAGPKRGMIAKPASAAPRAATGGNLMRIAIGADSAGQPLLAVIARHLENKPDTIVSDLSSQNASEFYADTAERVAKAVVEGRFDRGLLFCGTGIGVCIAANKVRGIRAALTHDTYSAERAAKSNNAQIITMGARVVGPELAKAIVDTFLRSIFDPAGTSAANVAALNALDSRNANS